MDGLEERPNLPTRKELNLEKFRVEGGVRKKGSVLCCVFEQFPLTTCSFYLIYPSPTKKKNCGKKKEDRWKKRKKTERKK